MKIHRGESSLLVYIGMVFVLMIYSLQDRLTEGAVPVIPHVHITITVTQETTDGVHLTWQSSSLSQELLQKCSLHYGDLKKSNASTQDFHPQGKRISLKDLEANVSYYALITCQHGKTILPSNTVQFTTKQKPSVELKPKKEEFKNFFETFHQPVNPTEWFYQQDSKINAEEGTDKAFKTSIISTSPKSTSYYYLKDENVEFVKRLDRHQEAVREVPKIQPSRHFSANAPQKDPDEGILVVMSQRHMDGPRVDPHNSKPSTSVILGVMCGVVGFIIINVTVVMAVRQFSLRRDRQRRMLELQLEQHGGCIYNIEEVSTT